MEISDIFSEVSIRDIYRVGRPSIYPNADFKKQYNFIWSFPQSKQRVADSVVKAGKDILAGNLSAAKDSLKGVLDKIDEGEIGTGLVEALFGDDFILCYMSQLAVSVNPPQDEIETQPYTIGLVDYPVPTKYRVNPITVTYLDDSFETVWKFHKAWMNSLRKSSYDMMMHFIRPPAAYLRAGRYVTFDNTLSPAEYTVMYKAMYVNFAPDIGIVRPMTTTDYPGLFPTSLKRDDGNKEATGLSRVTVTYTRFPVVQKADGTPGKLSGVRSI